MKRSFGRKPVVTPFAAMSAVTAVLLAISVFFVKDKKMQAGS